MAESGRFRGAKMNGPKVYVLTTVQFRPFGPDRFHDRSFSPLRPIVHFQPPSVPFGLHPAGVEYI